MTAVDVDGFAELLGMEYAEVRPGYSRTTVPVTEQLTNPYGVLHGAAAYAMADSGMGAAVFADIDPDEQCATIEIKISYLESVTDGTLTCETELVRRGRSVAFLESTITRDDEPVARATGSFSIFPRP